MAALVFPDGTSSVKIIEVVDSGSTMPSTKRRDGETVSEFVTRLRQQGHDDEANAVEQALSVLTD